MVSFVVGVNTVPHHYTLLHLIFDTVKKSKMMWEGAHSERSAATGARARERSLRCPGGRRLTKLLFALTSQLEKREE